MPDWRRADTVMDALNVLLTVFDIAHRTWSKKGSIEEKFEEASKVLAERQERTIKEYAKFLQDETQVLAQAVKITDPGTKKSLRKWLERTKRERKRSHIRLILALAELSCRDNGDQVLIDFLTHLGQLPSDEERTRECIAYGLIPAEENEIFWSKMEELAEKARIAAGDFGKNHALPALSRANRRLDVYGRTLRRNALGRKKRKFAVGKNPSWYEKVIDWLFA